MKNYLIIGSIAIIVIIGVAMLTGNKDQSAQSPVSNPNTAIQIPSTQPNESPQTNTNPLNTINSQNTSIDYTDNGFSPKSITVKVGSTVTWTNSSSGPMWVASNPHPTHTDYPEFDEKSNAANGGTYSFTFTKVGSWGYHNHKDPSKGGTVIVQP